MTDNQSMTAEILEVSAAGYAAAASALFQQNAPPGSTGEET